MTGNTGGNEPRARTRWGRIQSSAGETLTLRTPQALTDAMAAATPPTPVRGRWAGHGMSQATLADLAGCHPSFIGKLATGGTATVTRVLAERIAEALGVPLSSLFTPDTPTSSRPGMDSGDPK